MDSDTTINAAGGIHTLRGMLYQTYSLMFYWIKRAKEFPDLEIAVETTEDATFVYPNTPAGGLSTIELVQCKKAESNDGFSVYLGTSPIDRWQPASCDISHLRQWTSMRSGGYSTQDELKKENRYFTVLLFGEPTTTLRCFVPKGIQDRSPLGWYAAEFSRLFPRRIATLKTLYQQKRWPRRNSRPPISARRSAY